MDDSTDDGLPFRFPSNGEPPWAGAEHSYASWIPNVSGHLSFGMIDGRGKCHTVNQHCDVEGARVIAAHERRSAQDFPLPGGLIGLLRRSVTQDFLFVGNTHACHTPYILNEASSNPTSPMRYERNGVLVGKVLVLPPDDEPGTDAIRQRLIDGIHREMDERLDSYLLNPPGELHGLPSAILTLIDNAKDHVTCFALNFAIFRTGEVRIWFNMAELLGRDVVDYPPTALELIVADALPSQAYYFLKDVFHFHYHHDPRTDQLLDITRLEPGRCAAEQDLSWRINILRGLAKVVVEYRQSNRPDSNKKALGVLAYADAFQSLLARVVRKKDVKDGFEPTNKIILYDFDHTKTSLEALDALADSARGAALQLFGIFVGVILSALALWSGAVQIQPILCGDKRVSAAICPPIKPGFTTDIVNQVVSNPLGFVVVLTILGGLAYIFLFKGVTNIPLAKPLLRFVRALSAAVGAEMAKRSKRDQVGYVFQLVFLLFLTFLAAAIAYIFTPKNEVAPVQARPPAPTNRDSLDAFVGRKPSDSGLFNSSVIASKIRDVLGGDYELFLRNMSQTSVLTQENSFLWVTGSRAGDRDETAYLVLDRKTQQLEIGIRSSGRNEVYRSIGAPLLKPADIQRFTGSFASDIGPFPVETSVCKMSSGGTSGGTIQLSGTMGGVETCSYRMVLRKGQVLAFNPSSARGIVVLFGSAAPDRELAGDELIEADGTYQMKVGWKRVGAKSDFTRPRRDFYFRLNVR
ncbi:hypothetical protein [Novosphingobium capsulatum]|uniref:hypothetical protein n=1 Tax=Novosphingobium capsulatum TaxID=13688 RepID=UPI0012ED4EB8|nr:hypothetical protein [Novosphingobium capsulatum]WQD92536.1 hypothetical protein U0041_16330 [Novosphingobium capsulatum]